MTHEVELLRQFATEGSEPALGELVARRIDFVYAVALRRVGGDSHLAQEVAQDVFIALARKARVLALRADLTGWLYTSTWFAAAKALRARSRRLIRETEAHAMQNDHSEASGAELAWEQLHPVIDETMHELREGDREAILLRYFEGRSFAEVGQAIGLPENSARMRVERALDKLRGRLATRGITSTASALALALANQPAICAPAGLAAATTSASLAGAAGGGALALWQTLQIMSMSKLKLGAACALLGLAGTGAYWANQLRRESNHAVEAALTSAAEQSRQIAALRQKHAELLAENERLAAAHKSTSPSGATPAIAEAAGLSPQARLQVLADVQKGGIRVLVMPLAPNGKFSPDFVDLFYLTPSERETLQQAVEDTRQRVFALVAANASAKIDDQGRLAIEVKPFAGGDVIYDSLLEKFGQTLGAERNACFLKLAATYLEQSLHQFGAQRRFITITHNRSRSGGDTYDILDRHIKADGGSGSFTTSVRTTAGLADRYGPLVKLLPPDF